MPLMPGATWAGFGQCEISPSDLASNVDNLFSKIAALEQRVALLEAANTTANQLSDIAAQLGWVTNVNYNGIGGWTQTPNGTLIPPVGVSLSSLGWTMSDGTSWNFGGIDSNNNLTLGIGPDGTVGGTMADYWNQAAANAAEALSLFGPMDYGRAWTGSLNGTSSDVRGMTLYINSGGDQAFTVSRAGLYLVAANVSAVTSIAGFDTNELTIYINGSSANGLKVSTGGKPDVDAVNNLTLVGTVTLLAGNIIEAFWDSVGGNSIINMSFSVIRLSS